MGEYRAPGVYVEEIPSAQQPIAGVGTNTVGFIGLVPDIIYYPEPNLDYDPVVAQAALRLAELRAEAGTTREEIDTATRPLTREVQNLQREHDQLVAQRPTLVTAEDNARTTLNNAQTARDNAREGDDISQLEAAVHSATQALDQAQADLRDLDSQIQMKLDNIGDLTRTITGPAPAGPAPAGPAPAGPAPQPNPDQEPDESVRLLRQSVLKPYVLKPFEVKVEPYDTKLCTNFTEYTNRFGPFSADDPDTEEAKALCPEHRALTHAVNGFFKNGGTRCFVARVDPRNVNIERVLEAFESIDELAIIAAPGLREDDLPNTWDNLTTFCEGRENCFAILDSHANLGDENDFLDVEKLSYANPRSLLPSRNRNAAFYVPHIEVGDPAKQLQDEDPLRKVDPKYKGRVYVPPSGHIAGIYARTDEERGVHKAPANTTVLGALNVAYYISKPKQELLNPQGVNCIRTMNGNITVWGARTAGGDKNGEWKYINVRRLFLFLRKSIDEGTQWVVFEPNDPTLWGKIRRNLTAFLTNVWRSGALFGLTPEEAFYVKCDAETNPPEVRDLGQVITEVGVAIVRPAEFVIFRVTQATGPRTS
jgi:phage tail sheath protein FI